MWKVFSLHAKRHLPSPFNAVIRIKKYSYVRISSIKDQSVDSKTRPNEPNTILVIKSPGTLPPKPNRIDVSRVRHIDFLINIKAMF